MSPGYPVLSSVIAKDMGMRRATLIITSTSSCPPNEPHAGSPSRGDVPQAFSHLALITAARAITATA
jgi:hypothetical protein